MAKQPKQQVETDPPHQEVEKEITYECPTRGTVTQKIKVKVFPTGGTPTTQVCH